MLNILIISQNTRSNRQRCNTTPQKLFSFLLAKSITPSFRRQKNDRMAVKIKINKEFEEGGALLPIFTPFAYWLSVIYVACTPLLKIILSWVHFKRGVHASFFLDFQFVIPLKWAKVHPPLQTLSQKTHSNAETQRIIRFFIVIFSFTSGSLLIRF